MKNHPAAYVLLFFLTALFMLGSCGGAPTPVEITVASYNIRQKNHDDSVNGDGWGRRLPVLASLVRFHGFDIFGTQEGFRDQLDSLKALLPGYDYVGVGREDGVEAGEHSAIFYRTDMFDLTDKGDFWLSETPDRPSVGWDAVLPRICSWGRFRHIATGRELQFFNLHMDHIGKQARVESALLVKRMMEQLGAGIPTFLTGDFNVDQTHSSYAALTGDGRLKDSYIVADDVYAPNGTFNSYRADGYTESRIDHIFVSPEVHVLNYGVLTDTYRTPLGVSADSIDAPFAPSEISIRRYVARTPSDHFPVVAKVRF